MKKTYTTSHQINYGKRIIPIKMVELFSPKEWEEFIEEWIDLKKTKYLETERFGGAGDKGRDVVGYLSDKYKPDYEWDCYQCKHYNKPLMPTQVYKEFGKILYHSYLKEFPIPKNYYFIAPKGCGTDLSKLLQDTELLKKAIIANWEKYCKKEITNFEVELKDDFLNFVENYNYSIFSKLHVKDIINEHKKHQNHLIRFGGGLPEREKLDEKDIPSAIQVNETIYVQELLKAYGSQSGFIYTKVEDFVAFPQFTGHFKRARISFHHAEQLRNFSRDSLPIDTFEDFQNEIFSGVIDIVEDSHPDGFIKVKEVEKEARKIVIMSNPLRDVSILDDRSGVCHQLANEKKLKWT
ncbi:MAG: ABC-three component system protein [Flavobacteriales bacterium]